MMKNIALHSLLVLAFTVLLISDFFPEFPVIGALPVSFLFVVIIVIYIVMFITKAIDSRDPLYRFKTQLFLTTYLVVMVFALTALGGESELGITPYHEIFWFIVIVSFGDLLFQWRRVKRHRTMNPED